jgi:hypothetical protein
VGAERLRHRHDHQPHRKIEGEDIKLELILKLGLVIAVGTEKVSQFKMPIFNKIGFF